MFNLTDASCVDAAAVLKFENLLMRSLAQIKNTVIITETITILY